VVSGDTLFSNTFRAQDKCSSWDVKQQPAEPTNLGNHQRVFAAVLMTLLLLLPPRSSTWTLGCFMPMLHV
jgi:hypothetical protein